MNEKSRLKIVILYEGLNALGRAQKHIEHVLGQAISEFAIETFLWEFDELQAFPQLREQAATEVVGADLVLVSTPQASELPIEIWNWIETWAPRQKGRHATLIALIGHEDSARNQLPLLEAYFRQIAEIGGMEFFCDAAYLPRHEQRAPVLAGSLGSNPGLKDL